MKMLIVNWQEYKIWLIEPIMQFAEKGPFSKIQKEDINNCRMYLQVTIMSEITNSTGTHLLNEVYEADKPQNFQQFREWSHSKATWPQQPCPNNPSTYYYDAVFAAC